MEPPINYKLFDIEENTTTIHTPHYLDNQLESQLESQFKKEIDTRGPFEHLKTYFGIDDQNPTIKIQSKVNAFSTNIFIPMEAKITSKSYLYLTGFIKLVETFLVRTTKLNSLESHPKWMIFIYYDGMFEHDYLDDLYKPRSNNNNFNKEVKKNYSEFSVELKLLLKLYKAYIQHIKSDPKKYHFVKLYSFNCDELKRKFRHPYLGHPATFG
jgi:hypothetical protein